MEVKLTYDEAAFVLAAVHDYKINLEQENRSLFVNNQQNEAINKSQLKAIAILDKVEQTFEKKLKRATKGSVNF